MPHFPPTARWIPSRLATAAPDPRRRAAVPLCLEQLGERIVPSITPLSFADSLTYSPEYYGRVTTADYRTFLGRDPSASEVAGWVSSLQGGMTIEQEESMFIGSPEFIAQNGGGSSWVTAMYGKLLGRAPDATGLASWTAALDDGTDPSDIALGFAAGAEREGQHVTDLYQTLLSRAPSPDEVSGWVDAFSQGTRNEDLMAAFIASPEYAARRGGDAGQLVASAYADVLGREADPAGFASTVQGLDPNFFDQINQGAGVQATITADTASYAKTLTPQDLYVQSAMDPNFFANITLGQSPVQYQDGDYLYTEGGVSYYYGGYRIQAVSASAGPVQDDPTPDELAPDLLQSQQQQLQDLQTQLLNNSLNQPGLERLKDLQQGLQVDPQQLDQPPQTDPSSSPASGSDPALVNDPDAPANDSLASLQAQEQQLTQQLDDLENQSSQVIVQFDQLLIAEEGNGSSEQLNQQEQLQNQLSNLNAQETQVNSELSNLGDESPPAADPAPIEPAPKPQTPLSIQEKPWLDWLEQQQQQRQQNGQDPQQQIPTTPPMRQQMLDGLWQNYQQDYENARANGYTTQGNDVLQQLEDQMYHDIYD